jgi:hypothetical protein
MASIRRNKTAANALVLCLNAATTGSEATLMLAGNATWTVVDSRNAEPLFMGMPTRHGLLLRIEGRMS